MKRTLTLFCLGLALTFALAGCTRDKMPNVPPTPAGGSPVSTPSGEPMRPDGTVRPDETYRPSPTPIPEGTLNPTGTPGVAGSAGAAGSAVRPGASGSTRGTRGITENSAGTTADTRAGEAARDVARGVGDAARDVVDGVGDAARDIGNGVRNAVR